MNPLSGRARSFIKAVHAEPGITRAAVAARLELSTGAATEVTARLAAARLITETPSTPTGARGRPSTRLGPHPDGPLVVVVAHTDHGWRAAVSQLGGTLIAATPTLSEGKADLSAAVDRFNSAYPGRIRRLAAGVGPGDALVLPSVRIPASVHRHVTAAAVAEVRRGPGIGQRRLLHLEVDREITAALIQEGTVLIDAAEVGHLPFGDPNRLCRCGAPGCWETEAGLGHSEVGGAAARVLGRGVAGLANALKPDAVTLGGAAAFLSDKVMPLLHEAYEKSLTDDLRAHRPPLTTARLDDDRLLVGAAELAWDALWADLCW